MRVSERGVHPVFVWMYYYLGVRDGRSASLQCLNPRNPKSLKDAEWRTMLRSYLPRELAALREPHASDMAAVKLIQQQFMEIYSTWYAKRRRAQNPRKMKD